MVDKHGTRQVAEAYLQFLFRPETQRIIARHYYRPTVSEVAQEFAEQFPQLELFTIDEVFGGWEVAQKEHFDDGGIFDQIIAVSR
jgi:sulfate transport system substrate-binding protein